MQNVKRGLQLFLGQIKDRVDINVTIVTILFPDNTKTHYSFFGYFTKEKVARGVYYNGEENEYFFGSLYPNQGIETLYNVSEELKTVFQTPYGEVLQQVYLCKHDIRLCKGKPIVSP